MVKSIYIVSTRELSGKSVIIISLALKAKELGKKVGYFKPVGIRSSLSGEGDLFIDKDVEIMKEIIGLEEEIRLICPLNLNNFDFLEEYRKKQEDCIARIKKIYREISLDKDIVLIEGANKLSTGSSLDLSTPKLAADFSSKLLLVARVEDDSVVDELLQARDYCLKWDVKPFGVILNRVPGNMTAKTEYVIKPFLEERGLEVLGIVPEESLLSAPTVKEIHENIGGKILAGYGGMGNSIDSFLIGAMTMESASRYFRRAKNPLIVTGGDRTDVILAAIESGSSAIILTGNLYPSVKILPKADEHSVPIILMRYDTFTTLQLVQKIIGKIKPGDEERIKLAKRLLEEYVDWTKILVE